MQRLGARSGDAVGASTLVAGFDGLDQSLVDEPAKGGVERAGGEMDVGELLDVFRQRVAVPGAPRQAGEDQCGRAAVTTQSASCLSPTSLPPVHAPRVPVPEIAPPAASPPPDGATGPRRWRNGPSRSRNMRRTAHADQVPRRVQIGHR